MRSPSPEDYAAMGKEVVRLRREVFGFIANRLQDAVWREMLHMIVAGEATFEEIDRAVVHGPGLRWVGLEDNLYLSRGVFASNAQLVARAVEIVERLGGAVAGPAAVRERLGLAS